MCAGLFHKAIVMSGSVTSQWPIPTEQLALAQRQADKLDCPAEPMAAMMDCLMSVRTAICHT